MLSACLGALALFGQPAHEPSGRAASLYSREWSQPGADASSSASVDVAPLVQPPQLAWEQSHDELLAGPVTWSGTLYAVSRKGRDVRLRGIEIATGDERFKVQVPAKTPVRLLATPDRVLLVYADKIASYLPRGDRLVVDKTLALPDPVRVECAAAAGRWLFLPSASHTRVVELAKLALLDEALPASRFRAWAAEVPGADAVRFAVVAANPDPGMSHTQVLDIYSFSAAAKAIGRAPGQSMTLPNCGNSLLESSARLHTLGKPGPGLPSCWAFSGLPCRQKNMATLILRPEEDMRYYLGPISGPGIAHATSLYGFDDAGGFVQVLEDGRYMRVIEKAEDLPSGARSGIPTRARDVAYLGNWAVDLGTRRVLWCDPTLPDGPAIPCGDERIVYATAGKLACYAGGAASAEKSTAAAGDDPPPLRPGSGPALVLRDGKRIAGAAELDANRVWRVRTNGAATEIPDALVAAVERESGVELREPYAAYLAWAHALDAEHVGVLRAVFDEYRSARLLADCQRVLGALRTLEGGNRTADELQRSLLGQRENDSANAADQRRRIERSEAAAAARRLAALQEGAAWFEALGARLPASALYQRAHALDARVGPPLDALRRLIPAEFPARDAPSEWGAWALDLLPTEAEFLAGSSPALKTLEGTLWSRGSLYLQTPRLLLVSRARDRETVTRCLRSGDAALRAMHALFGGEARPDAPVRLEARMHANEGDYRGERAPDGELPMPWSAGYYSPAEKVSRFFVPDVERGVAGRGLAAVVAHELCHHYLDVVWSAPSATRGARNPLSTGYWIVEGVARYVEDQVLEINRRGFSFDDPTVRSVDIASQASKAGKLLALARILPLDHAGFLRLGDEPMLDVRLRHTLVGFRLSERSLFYEQAGALVFFLLHRSGDAGRAAFRATLAAHYNGQKSPPLWQQLGDKDAAALQERFAAFLSDPLRAR